MTAAAQALSNAYTSGLFLGALAGLCLGAVVDTVLFFYRRN